MARTDIFIKAYEEIIKPQLIDFDSDSETFGISYMCKDYPVRLYAKEGSRYLQCNCLGTIMKPAALCKHNVATIISHFLAKNPNLLLIDLNTFRFKDIRIIDNG